MPSPCLTRATSAPAPRTRLLDPAVICKNGMASVDSLRLFRLQNPSRAQTLVLQLLVRHTVAHASPSALRSLKFNPKEPHLAHQDKHQQFCQPHIDIHAAVPPHFIFLPRARMAALCDSPLQNCASIRPRKAFPHITALRVSAIMIDGTVTATPVGVPKASCLPLR